MGRELNLVAMRQLPGTSSNGRKVSHPRYAAATILHETRCSKLINGPFLDLAPPEEYQNHQYGYLLLHVKSALAIHGYT